MWIAWWLSLAQDKIEIKKEMMFNYQLKTTNFYNIPIGIIKKWCLTILIMKSVCFIMKLATLFKIRIEAEKKYSVFEFNQSQSGFFYQITVIKTQSWIDF